MSREWMEGYRRQLVRQMRENIRRQELLDYLENSKMVLEGDYEFAAGKEDGEENCDAAERAEGVEQAAPEEVPVKESIAAPAEVESENEGSVNEQAAEEETAEETSGSGAGWDSDQDTDEGVDGQEMETVVPYDTDTEVAAEVESHENEVVNEQAAGEEVLSSVDTVPAGSEAAAQAQVVWSEAPLYSVNGKVLREDIQTYFYQKLCAAGIGWFFETALMLAYQESSFDIYAQNPNGLDKGLLQYRLPYWPQFSAEAGRPGADIFDPFAQIDVFVYQMARRIMTGHDVNAVVSMHNMSDYGPYNPVYVDQVMQHRATLTRVR